MNSRITEIRSKLTSSSNLIYISGDPGMNILILGIGKSAAFASLVHNLNTGSNDTKAAFKNAFPIVKPF